MSRFQRVARASSHAAGNPVSFGIAVALVLGWAISGPLFGFSDTWQLVINTATTILTFLMVFLIQNTQNRDSEAMQLKLDELLRALPGTHNTLLDIEELSSEELDRIKKDYEALACHAREQLRKGLPDLGCPEINGHQVNGHGHHKTSARASSK